MPKWVKIVHEHGPVAYGVAWRILGHAEDVEDVVQEVFLECYQLVKTGDIRHWRTFVSRLATFRALDKLRRRRPTASIEKLAVFDKGPGPDDAAMAKESEVYLRSVIAGLPERQGAVFCLSYFEDLSPSEIATILDVSANAVSIALHKARTRLRAKLEQVNGKLGHEANN